jgi:hypothetical protein
MMPFKYMPKSNNHLDIMVHPCNPSTQETEAGVQGQPGYIERHWKKKNQKKSNNKLKLTFVIRSEGPFLES